MKKDNNIKEEDKNQIKEENKIETSKTQKEIKNSSNNGIEIKKPIINKEEYQNVIKKREIMKKNSKYKPLSLLFGKKRKQNLSIINHSAIKTSPNINNTNIQINNYTTYLTSVESIKEENYQKDGKTLMIENPSYYSMKQLNYKTRNTRLNQIMIIYIKKINESEDIYNFTNIYLSYIIQIFEKLCHPYITSLTNLFTNHIRPQLKYYQEMIPIYQEFSSKIKNLGAKEIEETNNTGANLINSVLKINNSFSNNFNLTSNNIQNIILNNQLYIKLDTIEPKYNEIYNKMKLYINKLIKRQNKYQDKYKKDMEPYFIGIKQRLNNTTFYEFLSLSKDFIFIHYDLISYTNKILSKISNFLINMDLLFKTSHNTFCDYLELLNIMTKSFYKDNKNIMNIRPLLKKKSIIYLDNLANEKNIRRAIDKRFEFNKIIENCNKKGLFNDINHSLLNYRDHLIQFNYFKKEEIEDIINFNLISYDSSEKFIQFLMRLIPEKHIFKFNDLVELKMSIKKSGGLLLGWKNILLITTYQSHIYLFNQDKKKELDKKKEEDLNKKMSKKDIINSIIDEDNKIAEIKKNEKTDFILLYDALKEQKLFATYTRNNFGMVNLISNTSKTMVQFYENYNDFKQYNPIIIDMISEQNINALTETIRANKIL
jgi:hypothetical protein